MEKNLLPLISFCFVIILIGYYTYVLYLLKANENVFFNKISNKNLLERKITTLVFMFKIKFQHLLMGASKNL